MQGDREGANRVLTGLFRGAADKRPFDRFGDTVELHCNPPRKGDLIHFDDSHYRVVDVVWEMPFDKQDTIECPRVWLHVTDC